MAIVPKVDARWLSSGFSVFLLFAVDLATFECDLESLIKYCDVLLGYFIRPTISDFGVILNDSFSATSQFKMGTRDLQMPVFLLPSQRGHAIVSKSSECVRQLHYPHTPHFAVSVRTLDLAYDRDSCNPTLDQYRLSASKLLSIGYIVGSTTLFSFIRIHCSLRDLTVYAPPYCNVNGGSIVLLELQTVFVRCADRILSTIMPNPHSSMYPIAPPHPVFEVHV